MAVVPFSPRQPEHGMFGPFRSEDLLALAHQLALLLVTPIAEPPPPTTPDLTEAELAQYIQRLLEEDAEEYRPLFRPPTLKDIVKILREVEGEPVDLIALVGCLAWKNRLAPLDVIKQVLAEGLQPEGPLEMGPDHCYVLKKRRRRHAAGRAP